MADLLDNCPAISNPAQQNTVHPETPFGDHCEDPDEDNISDAYEGACGSDPNNEDGIPERFDGEFAGQDDDQDNQTDEPLPSSASTADCDGDGWTGLAENKIYDPNGTLKDQDPCGTDGWPANLVDPIGSAPNRVDIRDLLSFLVPLRRLDTSSGSGFFSARWDLLPGRGALATDINIQDVISLLSGSTGRPPMFSGQRSFDRTCPWP
jgi:hypothetical protein